MPSATILSVKTKIKDMQGIQLDQQHLYLVEPYGYVYLENLYSTLSSYRVVDGDTIELDLRVRGG